MAYHYSKVQEKPFSQQCKRLKWGTFNNPKLVYGEEGIALPPKAPKKAKAPETPLDLDYSSCGDFDDHQPLMADSGSIMTSKKRPIAIQRNSSFFENISQNNNPESSEWQPKQIPADMGAAQEE